MRKHINAGELLAILGLDSKNSEWTVWNRMTEDEQSQVGDYGRWQSRLAGDIMQGICKDHDLKCEGAIENNAENGVMPPRAWKISPNARTNGKPSVIIVGQKTSAQMFGWEAPSTLPERQRIRLLATAIAYDVEHVFYGVLVDGYRSELYGYAVDPEEREHARNKIDEMIRMVIEDDEPMPDYDVDRSAVRSGKAVTKADATKESVNDMVERRESLLAEAKRYENQAKPLKAEADKIDTTLIHLLSSSAPLDCGKRIVSITETATGVKKVKITDKKASAESLF